jgi:hypothetical protein
MAMIARVWRVLAVAAFVLAQTNALAHPLRHLGTASSGQASLSASSPDDAKTQRDGPLCDFHTALGAVLGALGGGSFAAQFVEPSHIDVPAVHFAAVSLSGLAPASRGPPLHP